MSHGVMSERVVLYNEGAWHKLGVITKNATMTAKQALEMIGADIIIDKMPVNVDLGDGTFLALDDKFALVRRPTLDDPQHRTFGIVGNDYTVVQNGEIADMLDSTLTDVYPVETAGILHDGKTIFYLLRGMEFQVKGEDCKCFFAATDTRDGKSSQQFLLTATRIVCQNTLQIAQRNALSSLSIRHNATIKVESEMRLNALREAMEVQKDAITAMQHVASLECSEATFLDMLEVILPSPKIPNRVSSKQGGALSKIEDSAEYAYEWRVAQTEEGRDRVSSNYQRLNDQFPKIARTRWAAFNAVTEYTTHQVGKNNIVRARESVFGKGADMSAKAFQYLSKAK